MSEREYKPETRVKSLRATYAQFARWAAVAARQGLSYNRWAVQALDDQAALDDALEKERSDAEVS